MIEVVCIQMISNQYPTKYTADGRVISQGCGTVISQGCGTVIIRQNKCAESLVREIFCCVAQRSKGNSEIVQMGLEDLSLLTFLRSITLLTKILRSRILVYLV